MEIRFTLLLLVIWFSTAFSQEKIEIEGAIIVKNSEDTSPALGTIRFNNTTNDFEGWHGQWVSLTNTSTPTGSGRVTDIDGNQYLTVTIGTQMWMRENLRVTRYRNGDPIPEVLLNSDWAALSTGAWNWYDHNPEKDISYGKLYNWFAVNDNRGVCPTGWHVPTDTEWTTLTDFLGGLIEAGGKMKTTGTVEAGTGYWSDPNTDASNESGFTGLPGGFRRQDGLFFDMRDYFYLWSSTQSSSTHAWQRRMRYNSGAGSRVNNEKEYGCSIRCVKD